VAGVLGFNLGYQGRSLFEILLLLLLHHLVTQREELHLG
jgi:hypothetical protein